MVIKSSVQNSRASVCKSLTKQLAFKAHFFESLCPQRISCHNIPKGLQKSTLKKKIVERPSFIGTFTS